VVIVVAWEHFDFTVLAIGIKTYGAAFGAVVLLVVDDWKRLYDIGPDFMFFILLLLEDIL